MTDAARATSASRRSASNWFLATATALLALALPFLQHDWSPERLAVIVAAELFLGCLFVWLIDPSRFAGAVRLICFLVFLAYAKHMLDELAGSRPPHEAVIGFIVLGLPALGYAAFGRFIPASIESAAGPRHSEATTADAMASAGSEAAPVGDASPARPDAARPDAARPDAARPDVVQSRN